MVYCTLFDSNYLDRALVMINSLVNVDDEAKIYVLCMDNVCYEILSEEKISNVHLIELNEFEDEELLSVKSYRSKGEYCWSCTAKLIYYILKNKKESICTYIDSDMKFYSNPNVLIKEMYDSKCNVQTIPHRFALDSKRIRKEKSSGRNCVQFNTFTNRNDSMLLLKDWINECIKKCSVFSGGDQLYTDKWAEDKRVNVSTNIGAGVAPWNVNRYREIDTNNHILFDKYTREKGKLIFYHFQDLVFPKDNIARVIPYLQYIIFDRKFVKSIYQDYLSDLYIYNKYIGNKYKFKPLITKYITENKGEKKVINYKRILKMPINELIDKVIAKIIYSLRLKESEFKFINYKVK